MTYGYDSRHEFGDFEAAKGFARSLAADSTRHKITREGQLWVVYSDSSKGRSASLASVSHCENCELLRKELLTLQRSFESSERWVNELTSVQEELKRRHQAEVDQQIERGIEKAKSHYESLSEQLTRERSRLADDRALLAGFQHSLEHTEEKFKLLREAYIKKVGQFRFEVRREEAPTKQICQRCAGDGGINQGCPSCDGTGMARNYISTTEIVPL